MFNWREFFVERETMMPERYYAQSHSEKMVSFSFANAASITQVRHIHEQLTRVYMRGGTFRDFKKLAQKGPEALELPVYRIENIFRTNIMTAYARGSYLEQATSKEVFPYGKYVAVIDSATRKTHAALNGLILKVGTPEYNQVYPPNGYNCRCGMRALTERQAEREGGYSEEKAKKLVSENPPDNRFEGPPFYGDVPEDLNIPATMTDEQAMAWAREVRQAEDNEYWKALSALEEEGAGASARTIERASDIIPESVVDAKLKEMKYVLDSEFMKEFKSEWAERGGHFVDVSDDPTPLELATSRKISNDVKRHLQSLGVLGPEASRSDKDRAVKGLCLEFLGLMRESARGRGRGMTLEQFYEMYSSSADREFSRLGPGTSYRYSSSVMRLLSVEERVFLNLWTKFWDQQVQYTIRNYPNGKDAALIKKYFGLLTAMEESLDQHIVRQPVKLYRGVSVGGEWRDKASGRSLTDLAKTWEPSRDYTFSFQFPTSFASDYETAEIFAAHSDKPGRAKIVFQVMSDRAAPIETVSASGSGEHEHLMRPGEKYRITGVEKRERGADGGGIDYLVTLEELEPKAKAEYKFAV
jgi:SPP1 gp7 family putative phage head morphogenesis protein